LIFGFTIVCAILNFFNNQSFHILMEENIRFSTRIFKIRSDFERLFKKVEGFEGFKQFDGFKQLEGFRNCLEC